MFTKVNNELSFHKQYDWWIKKHGTAWEEHLPSTNISYSSKNMTTAIEIPHYKKVSYKLLQGD